MNAATEEDLVRRQFTAEAPDRLWLTGITEHCAADGKLYCGGRAAEVRHNQLQGTGVLAYPLSQRVTRSSRFRNVMGGTVIDALRSQEAPVPDHERERRMPLGPEHLARTGPLTHLPSIHDDAARPSRPVHDPRPLDDQRPSRAHAAQQKRAFTPSAGYA